jgi:phage-related protein
MSFLKILYYPGGDSGPVKNSLEALSLEHPAAFIKLRLDLEVLGTEGLRSQRIDVRSLGQGLWELRRRHEGLQYRLFFCAGGGYAWLLHAIEKKSAKTPLDDLQLARKRMRGLLP